MKEPTTPRELVADMHKRVAEERARLVEDIIKLRVYSTVDVELRRPRWMPERVYRWLLGTIVVKAGPTDIRPGDPS